MTSMFSFAVARRPAAVTFAALLIAHPGYAQDFGDTPYVQTPQNVVERMLQVAQVGPGDYVIDLGSGDGRMVITAARKFGARGFGVDLDRRLVEQANRSALRAGVADRAMFYERDLYQTDLAAASVVTLYLLPEVNLMVRPKLLATLKPGTRIVAHDYGFEGRVAPEKSITITSKEDAVEHHIMFWTTPLKVEPASKAKTEE
jgi:protein-L-isoaspartate O-methyltransferase